MEQKTTITFQAAECGEFHNLGQYVECETLKEAYRTYQRFLKTSPQMGPSLEFTPASCRGSLVFGVGISTLYERHGA